MEKLSVLVVEDDPQYAQVLLAYLDSIDEASFITTHCSRLSDALDYVSRCTPDLALLDLNLPDSAGLMTLRAVRAAAPKVGIVVLSGIDEFEIARTALKEGAQDFLVKAGREQAELERALLFAHERIKRAEAEEQARSAQERIDAHRQKIISLIGELKQEFDIP